MTIGPFHLFPSNIKSSLSKTHVALIFGWTDGQLKHLEKYTSLYKTRGIDVDQSLFSSK